MFHDLTLFLTPLMEKYGAVGVFLGSIIEEVIAPIPSSAVVMSAGFLMTNGATLEEAVVIVALKVMLPASAGIALGALFPYFIARYGGEFAINKFGWLLGVKHADIEKAGQWFKKHKSDEILLFAARTVPVLPSVLISLFCGVIQMPALQFVVISFLGSLIRTFVLGMIGWYAGRTFDKYAAQINQVEDLVLYVFAILGVALVGWLFFRTRKKKA